MFQKLGHDLLILYLQNKWVFWEWHFTSVGFVHQKNPDPGLTIRKTSDKHKLGTFRKLKKKKNCQVQQRQENCAKLSQPREARD